MQFDDRLATVLRSGAAGERAARTQFRQLLDLLGSTPPVTNGPLVAAAYGRLSEICDTLPAIELSRILREPGLRLRNPLLIAHLAEGEPQVAAATMAAARMRESDWLDLIPELPVTARGFLRHRRDLPDSARRLLARLGVRDLVLPQPEIVPEPVDVAPAPAPVGSEGESGIGALVRRIEAFQKARRGEVAAHASPQIGAAAADRAPSAGLDFTTDAAGTIDWADAPVAPLLVGLRLAGAPIETALRRRAVVRNVTVDLPGAEAVAGTWRVDAAPRFDGQTGIFRGYAGRMRRPGPPAPPVPSPANDRMRQVLHELRTPVNAIQGFAEIIQQQLFGPAPNSYRALAGAIGVDAARLMAGFDEIDRLARLESGALALSSEGCDFRELTERTVRRLGGVTRPRNADLRLDTAGERFEVDLGADDAALLAWRLLASLAGALGAGEAIGLTLRGDGGCIVLECELPTSFAAETDPFSPAARSESPVVTAGMFGTGFTLRLARAEAEAAGGSLALHGETLVLSLPALTGAAPDHSQGEEGGASAAA